MTDRPGRTVEEVVEDGSLPLYRHPEWRRRFPWLVQGTTGAGEDRAYDLGSFGTAPVGDVVGRWLEIRRTLGMRTVIHARQVHGSSMGLWNQDFPEGLMLVEGLDGHITDRIGLLLTASIADCVPVFLVDERFRRLAMVHSGWRGVAGGAMERAMDLLTDAGSQRSDLWLHFGPSMCGECYEVGPEVHEAVNPHLPVPDRPVPIDLRAAMASRAVRLGIPAEQVTISAHCTRCGPGSFFSHRGGDAQRQMGLLGRAE